MKKILYYCTIAIACVLVIIAFVTATNYTQLAVAVVAYPILIYFIVQAFPRKKVEDYEIPTSTVAAATQPVTIKLENLPREEKTVTDVDKREFLKLIGITGLSLFVFSLFNNKKGGIPLLGGAIGQAVNTPQNSTIPDTSASGNTPFSGYRISEIDDGVITYYGFTNDSGAWLIMKEDTQTNSFRYVKGGSGFPANWINRSNLKFDYYYNLF